MSKNIIKTKFPPTLIIGLGGTGCDIVNRVDKLANSEQKENIRFVYFDTDANELRIRKEESPHVFTIQTSRRMNVGQALRSDREAREKSFPTSNQLLKKSLTEGAGQVRAVSKLAFDACLREGRITPLHDAISELMHMNGDTMEQSMRVVIVSTLVGGTGSGILLPVSMYLRNYLENICGQKPIIRGICVLPEVFFHDSNKTEVEKNNLRANAYATLRELDAFMLKADSRGKYDKFWLKMPTPGTVDNYDDYYVNPMDFCFVYDGRNMDGEVLQNLEAYKQHVADCVYASSVSMLNKRLNSSEDNTILARCEENGRNRYCGIGASKIVYPFEQVRDYIAMNWMTQVVTNEWMHYDKEYEKKVQKRTESRKKGIMLPPINKREDYCSVVNNEYLSNPEKNYFAAFIYNTCHIMDADKIEYTGSIWEIYYQRIKTYIDDRIEKDKYADEDIAEINIYLNSLNIAKEDTDDKAKKTAYQCLTTALKKYFSKTQSFVESEANNIADSLFSTLNFNNQNDENETRIEHWLKDGKSFIHPNAARYFLYNLENLLKNSKEKLTSNQTTQNKNEDEAESELISIGNIEKYIREFFTNKNYNVPLKKESRKNVTIDEYVDGLNVINYLNLDFSGEQDKNQWKNCVDKVIINCRKLRDYIKKYCEAKLELEIIEKALEFVDRLSTCYENFYSHLETEISLLPIRIKRIEDTFVNNTGNPVIYACASKECLKELLKRCLNTVDSISLTDEFRNDLFKNIYAASNTYNEGKQAVLINDFAQNKVLEFWRGQVKEQCGSKIDMDIIDALRIQAEIEDGKFEAEEQLHYIKHKKEEAMKLASPFIDRPIGIEPYIIDAYSLGAGVVSSSDMSKASIINSVFPSYENDAFMDKYQMLFMKALYNIRVSDLPKFAPADDNEIDPNPEGSYYKSYWKRINSVIPDDKITRVLTPHLDKRWHYIGVMPDLSEKSDIQHLVETHRALFISLVYGRIAFDRDQYRFKANGGDFISDSITVGDGKCNKFSEIYEAMLMSRPLVIEQLDYYKAHVKTEKEKPAGSISDYKSHEMYELLTKTKLDPYKHNLSFMEIPILYKATVGSYVRCDDEAVAMLCGMIDFIEEYLTEFYSDVLDRIPYFVKWMYEQTKLLCDNLRNKYTDIMKDPINDRLYIRIKGILETRIKACKADCREGDLEYVNQFLEELKNDFNSESDKTD